MKPLIGTVVAGVVMWVLVLLLAASGCGVGPYEPVEPECKYTILIDGKEVECGK